MKVVGSEEADVAVGVEEAVAVADTHLTVMQITQVGAHHWL